MLIWAIDQKTIPLLIANQKVNAKQVTFSSLSERLEKWTLEKSLTTYKKGVST